MVDDVEAQQEFDDFFEEVFTELEDKVVPEYSWGLLPCSLTQPSTTSI